MSEWISAKEEPPRKSINRLNQLEGEYKMEDQQILYHGSLTQYLNPCLSYAPQPYGLIDRVEWIPPKVVRVTFNNGDIQKAVCSDYDDFDLERGIEVCICKHYLGGTKEFNKQLRQGLKCWDDACEAEMDRLQEEARIAKKKQKQAEQKKRRKARRELEERERQIKIQTEAILRANDIMRMREQ